MKPVISFTASQVPVNSNLNVSIVQKKLSDTEFRNYTSKTEFTNYIDTLHVPKGSTTYCYVKCQCGMEHDYANKDAVPAVNLTCSCGRKVIAYS